VLDPMASGNFSSVGEFGWGGAASTFFMVDPVEDITAVFLTQLLPSSTHPIRNELRRLIRAALVD
jgi:CubicO group peptidase (beta-lactamase class C family)